MKDLSKYIRMSDEEVELEYREQLLEECNLQLATVQRKLADDPLKRMIRIQIEFGELLKTYAGQERLTKEFSSKINSLHSREEQAKKDSKTYNLVELSNKECDLRLLLNHLMNRVSNLKFMIKLRSRKYSQEETDKELVQNILDNKA